MNLQTRKNLLRNRLRAGMKRLSPETAANASSLIRAFLPPLIESEIRPLHIGAFASLPGEPDLLPLVETVGEHDVIWHFPRVEGDQLCFHRIRSTADLATGAFGIREPQPSALGCLPASIDSIDCFLVPGLGFDPSTGRRIGRGRGFYDRCLAQARPGVHLIGVAFDFQLCDDIPVEPHDIPMDHVVTESGARSTAAG